ncbi:MAG: SanA protein [Ruminococcaceae bacterium]|nr:SanA protein [Oscillospiraceae bacterium]
MKIKIKKNNKQKSTKNGKQRTFLRIFCAILCLGFLGIGAVFGINAIVKGSVKSQILPPEAAAQLADVDCILVLGCGIHSDGTPSDMLHDRLRRGVELYQLGAAPKLLMTGDHGRENYDEVDAMKTFAVEAGIDSADIFMDHAGFSTYESMYRAKEIFQAQKILIVTQEYHLYRAIYIAESLGMEAYGVSSDYRAYSGQTGRDVREILARVKDFGTSLFQPKPTYLGEAIPIWGDGDLTNDENSDFT